jgi:membrane protein DedA with SNARE-associated domain
MMSITSLGVLFFWAIGASLGVPGTTVAIVSLGAIANNFSDLAGIVLVTALGAVIGDIVVYEITRKFSKAIRSKVQKFRFFSKNEKKAKERLKKHEFSFVFFTRFALIELCAPINYVSGFERLNRKKFFLAAISGEILFSIIYPLIGFIFKNTWEDLISGIQYVFIAIILIIVTIFLTRYLIKRRKKRQISR